jgi:integrase/recombinase XerD
MIELPEIVIIKLFPEQAVEIPRNIETPKSDDVFSAAELGCSIPPHGNDRTANIKFAEIEQDWFKVEAKKFIKHIARNEVTFNLVKMRLTGLKNFSSFLLSFPDINCMEDIDRSVMLKFIDYLGARKVRSQWKNGVIYTLKIFFEAGVINEWFTVKPHLIRDGDMFKTDNKSLPRYIPNEVIRQLEKHINHLPEPMMRSVLVVKECGLRAGELCQLPLDCLKRDSKGGWFIQFMRLKIQEETNIPISIELADHIQKQQKYIQEHLDDFPYLFCSGKYSREGFIPNNKIMNLGLFNWRLNKLAKDFNICDSTGKLWKFQSHQFRHTVGTSMINNGVPQHIVQKFLGHESSEMTSRYAHIHDSTLRREIDKYVGAKVVDITGQVIESLTPEIDSDSALQWMKSKIISETLSSGYCGLPAQLTCGKGNACLTCSDFRTTIEFLDQHKQHLERVNQVLEVATANDWTRQIQVNQDVKNSLEKIINTLEENSDV